jgi:hypothetical protein
MTKKPTIGDFLLAFGGQWFTMMSGPLSVPLACLALFVRQTALKLLFALLAVICAIVSSYGIWARERTEVNRLRDKLDEIDHSRPRLRPKHPNPVSVTRGFINMGQGQFDARFVRIRFINDPEHPYPSASADAVVAKLTFSSNGKRLLEMDGRWSDSDQPSIRDVRQSRSDLLATSFGIGTEHDLDIAFQDLRTFDLVAWNNDNYNYGDGRMPEHLLMGNNFQIHVRLLGPWIDESFHFEMRSMAKDVEVTQPPL